MKESEHRKSLLSRVDHIGVIVRDMDKAVEHYQSLGMGPFESLQNVVAVQRKLLGLPVTSADFKLKVRIARLDGANFELIQPVVGEFIWKESLDKRGEGINHVGFLVDDIEKATTELEERGFEVIYSARFENGGGAAYFDTAKTGGVLTEVVQWPPTRAEKVK